MIDDKEVLTMYEECFHKLEEACKRNLGREMCEASRMLIGVLSILQGYFPEIYTKKRREDSLALLDNVITQLTEDIRNGRDEEGHTALYKRNIVMRRETLDTMEIEACDVQNEPYDEAFDNS